MRRKPKRWFRHTQASFDRGQAPYVKPAVLKKVVIETERGSYATSLDNCERHLIDRESHAYHELPALAHRSYLRAAKLPPGLRSADAIVEWKARELTDALRSDLDVAARLRELDKAIEQGCFICIWLAGFSRGGSNVQGIDAALQGWLGADVALRRSARGKEWCRLSVGRRRGR